MLVLCRKSKLLEEIAGEKLSEEELAQRQAEQKAQSLVNAERVQFRHDEYQVRAFAVDVQVQST